MAATTHLSVELPREVADLVRARVASGAYASESDVITEGLALLEEQDASLEGWVETDLAAAFDAWRAEPADTATLDVLAARLDEESASRHPRN
jgi:putative addiction module CopG family antidote